jgi:hypothetical protein
MAAMNRSPVSESSRVRETFILYSKYDGNEPSSLPGVKKSVPVGGDEPAAACLHGPEQS